MVLGIPSSGQEGSKMTQLCGLSNHRVGVAVRDGDTRWGTVREEERLDESGVLVNLQMEVFMRQFFGN